MNLGIYSYKMHIYFLLLYFGGYGIRLIMMSWWPFDSGYYFALERSPTTESFFLICCYNNIAIFFFMYVVFYFSVVNKSI